MTDRELMQMALDAWFRDGGINYYDFTPYMEALRARLAQPEPEPVAWWHDRGDVVDLNVSGHGTPLYFAPPQREWVGLTDAEKKAIYQEATNEDWTDLDVINATEAKLREKNG